MSTPTRAMLEERYTAFVAETGVDVTQEITDASSFTVPEGDCLAAVKAEVGVTPVAATCSASSEGQSCILAFDDDGPSSANTAWTTSPSEPPVGAWIRLDFDQTTTVDKVVLASHCVPSPDGCNTSLWTDIRSGVQCGPCSVLALLYGSTSCASYCAAQEGGLDCVGSFTDDGNSCTRRGGDNGCDSVPASSDDICECAAPVGGSGTDAAIQQLLLEFSDGNDPQVLTLENECGPRTYTLAQPVTTSFVKATVQARHTANDPNVTGLREFRFYGPNSVADPAETQRWTWLTTVISIPNVPPGCSYFSHLPASTTNNAAFFNDDPVGCGGPSCEQYESVGPSSDSSMLWATQLSKTAQGSAWQVIDGDTGSCSETLLEVGPWWELDLGVVRQLTSVSVTPGRDHSNGLDVYIDGVACTTGVEADDRSTTRVPCVGTGRVIRIGRSGKA